MEPGSSSRVFWLVQAASDLPGDNSWLSADERRHLESLKVEKRRRDWRLGRWTAKRAIRAARNDIPLVLPEREALRGVEIRPATDGAPEAYVQGARVPVTVSLSHSAHLGFCTLASDRVAMGCDLERVVERSSRFLEDYFTEREYTLAQAASGDERMLLITLIWSAKESALKAMREGLRLDTRTVEVGSVDLAQAEDWSPLRVTRRDGAMFRGLWRSYEDFVLTIVADLAPEPVRCRPV